jgi:hypothetical protein
MRFVSFLFTMIGVVLFVVILATAGLSHPKALFGATVYTAFFAYHAARDFAFERKKKSLEFIAEKSRVLNILKKGSNFTPALEALCPPYRLVGDARGVSLRGSCRVVDLSSESAKIRIEVKNRKIIKTSVVPKKDKALRVIAATLKAEAPYEAPDHAPGLDGQSTRPEMKQSPNKAPEPTPGLVTPRALRRVFEMKRWDANRSVARGAPSPVVAHL